MNSVTTPTTNSGATAEQSTSPVAAEQSTPLRKTPLNGLHRRLGARMANFGGWDMAVEDPANGGVTAEDKAVRNGVGGVSRGHRGEIRITSRNKPARRA